MAKGENQAEAPISSRRDLALCGSCQREQCEAGKRTSLASSDTFGFLRVAFRPPATLKR